MRLSWFIFTIFTLLGCQPAAEVTTGSSRGPVNPEAPYLWENTSFPKQMEISSSFSPAEALTMTDMATKWKTSLSNTNLISFGSGTNNSFNLNAPDSVMGIYKATNWNGIADDNALAITQIFGRRYNVGAANEYVGVVHADIIVNYGPDSLNDYYTFDIGPEDGPGDIVGYDLRSIILHEMGHFLGLNHIPKYDYRPDAERNLSSSVYKASSVMYPFISDGVAKRTPQSKDLNALAYKYNFAGAGNYLIANSVSYKPNNNDSGKSVKIVIELRKSGECLHKEDGAVVKRHQVKFNN